MDAKKTMVADLGSPGPLVLMVMCNIIRAIKSHQASGICLARDTRGKYTIYKAVLADSILVDS